MLVRKSNYRKYNSAHKESIIASIILILSLIFSHPHRSPSISLPISLPCSLGPLASLSVGKNGSRQTPQTPQSESISGKQKLGVPAGVPADATAEASADGGAN
jgi:hypothetical protein